MKERTVSLTASEVASLQARTAESWMLLHPYVRHEERRRTAMPKHTELLLGKIERLDELSRRVSMVVAEDELRPE